MTSSRIAAVLAATLAAPALPAADWPQWRGPGRDASSAETGLLAHWPAGGPPLLWKATGLGRGFASVAVAGDRIFTQGDRQGAQHVIALSRTDGRTLWTARLGSSLDSEYGGARGTPTVDGDLLYAVGTEGDVVCLETATGRERWRKSLVRDFGGAIMSGWMFSESPLVDGDHVVVTPGAREAALVALDKRTGTTIWKAAVPDLGPQGRDGAGYSSIVISHGGGTKQYVQLLGRGLVGIRAADGKFLWGYNKVANRVANVSTPVVRGNHVFASTAYQTGSALLELRPSGDGVGAHEVYFLPPATFQSHHGGFVLVGDHLYGGHGHKLGFPIALELLTGKVAWGGDIRNAGLGSSAVVYADGHVYYRFQNGVVILVEAAPSGYREKGTFTIPEAGAPSWAHLAIADGRLYAREQDTLYVYDVRRPRP